MSERILSISSAKATPVTPPPFFGGACPQRVRSERPPSFLPDLSRGAGVPVGVGGGDAGPIAGRFARRAG